MKDSLRNKLAFFAFLTAFSFAFFPGLAYAQRYEHLTNEEIELLREYQEIDKRMEIYVKAVERRFLSLHGTQNLSKDELKRLKKDSAKWGELPNGSQTRLLTDIDKIIDEAINKLEDVAERNAESEHFSEAVHILSDNAKLFIPKLQSYGNKTEDAREVAVINSALGLCNDIIEASQKVPRPSKKKKKKKSR